MSNYEFEKQTQSSNFEKRFLNLYGCQFFNCKFEGISSSNSIGTKKTVRFNFSTEIDPEDHTKGMEMSGMLGIEKIEDFPQDTFGFIYIVTHKPSDKSYIGKKVLYHNVKKKLTKKELAEQTGPGRKSATKVVEKESDWKTYYGSAKPILALIKDGKQEEFTREILQLVPNKKLLTYYECKFLFEYGVLENPDGYFNDNIQGRFFTKDFAS